MEINGNADFRGFISLLVNIFRSKGNKSAIIRPIRVIRVPIRAHSPHSRLLAVKKIRAQHESVKILVETSAGNSNSSKKAHFLYYYQTH